MEKRCVITGLGLICAAGNDVDTCWQNICAGKTGIDEVKSVSTEGCVSHVGAEVHCENLPAPEYDRSVRLCLHAAHEAVRDGRLTDSAVREAGVILGSCVGGAASIDHYYTGLLQGRTEEQDVLKMSASAIAANTAFALGANGETANIVNACAAGTMSVSYACDLIRLGRGEIFLAGGTDAFSSLAYAGFNALHALSAGPCSPLNHSNGISLGEGAGVLVVEEYEHAIRRGAKIYCEVAGWGVSSDAFHITAPQPQGEGQMAALHRAMVNAGTEAGDIGYINAHGTGTAKNDAAEFLSLHTLFEGAAPSVSSTKSMTGHCLGAAGAIEAVLSVKAHGSSDDGLCPGGSGPAGRKGREPRLRCERRPRARAGERHVELVRIRRHERQHHFLEKAAPGGADRQAPHLRDGHRRAAVRGGRHGERSARADAGGFRRARCEARLLPQARPLQPDAGPQRRGRPARCGLYHRCGQRLPRRQHDRHGGRPHGRDHVVPEDRLRKGPGCGQRLQLSAYRV